MQWTALCFLKMKNWLTSTHVWKRLFELWNIYKLVEQSNFSDWQSPLWMSSWKFPLQHLTASIMKANGLWVYLQLKIRSVGTVHIIKQKVKYYNTKARWIPKRVNWPSQSKEDRIVTYETWIHHFESESKR